MITIVTDSSACLTREDALRLGVRLVPLTYNAGKHIYFESYSDQNGDFENLLTGRTRFSTSQPNLAAYLSAFEEELAKGNEVLCITISSRLSGAYSTAHMAARQTDSGSVAVFDSLSTAGGMYLLIRQARRLALAELPLSEIVKQLYDARDTIKTAFSVEDMTPLRLSGRLGSVRMSVATILNIKPILLCREGVIVSDGDARGYSDIIKRLMHHIPPGAGEVVINYLGQNRMAADIYNIVKKTRQGVGLRLRKLGPVLGIHLGPSVVGVSSINRSIIDC